MKRKINGLVAVLGVLILALTGCTIVETGGKYNDVTVRVSNSTVGDIGYDRMSDEQNTDSKNPDVQDNDTIKAQLGEKVEVGL